MSPLVTRWPLSQRSSAWTTPPQPWWRSWTGPPSGGQPTVAPLHQRDEYGVDVEAAFGGRVLVGLGVLAVEAPLEQTVFDEGLESIAEDVGGRAGVALDVGKAPPAEQDLSHDEQCPALTDDGQCAGDRAVLVVEGAIRHASED